MLSPTGCRLAEEEVEEKFSGRRAEETRRRPPWLIVGGFYSEVVLQTCHLRALGDRTGSTVTNDGASVLIPVFSPQTTEPVISVTLSSCCDRVAEVPRARRRVRAVRKRIAEHRAGLPAVARVEFF